MNRVRHGSSWLVGLLVALAVLGACGGNESAATPSEAPSVPRSSSVPERPAAVVDGRPVAVADLDEQLAAITANPAAVKELEEQGPITGSFRDGLSAGFVAQVLQSDVEALVVSAEVGRRRLEIPDGLGQALSEADPAFSSYSASYRGMLAARTAQRIVLAGALAGTPLTTTSIRKAFLAERAADGTYCVSAVVLGSRALATRVRSRLVGGASIAALAARLSVDPTTRGGHGKLGCGGLGDFADALASQVQTLEVGAFSRPVGVGGLFYVLSVRSRVLPTLAQAEAKVVQEVVTDYGPFNRFLDHALSTSAITVDPYFGSLDKTASPPTVTPRR